MGTYEDDRASEYRRACRSHSDEVRSSKCQDRSKDQNRLSAQRHRASISLHHGNERDGRGIGRYAAKRGKRYMSSAVHTRLGCLEQCGYDRHQMRYMKMYVQDIGHEFSSQHVTTRPQNERRGTALNLGDIDRAEPRAVPTGIIVQFHTPQRKFNPEGVSLLKDWPYPTMCGIGRYLVHAQIHFDIAPLINMV